jgi:hypothetical protein
LLLCLLRAAFLRAHELENLGKKIVLRSLSGWCRQASDFLPYCRQLPFQAWPPDFECLLKLLIRQ